jgi:hypothetical protein
MKKINLVDIIKSQDLELQSYLENYTEYSRPTLLYCYAEFKRRNLMLSASLLDAIKGFTERLNIDSLEDEVIKAAKSRGFDTYEELYFRIISPDKVENSASSHVVYVAPPELNQSCVKCGTSVMSNEFVCPKCGSEFLINSEIFNQQNWGFNFGAAFAGRIWSLVKTKDIFGELYWLTAELGVVGISLIMTLGRGSAEVFRIFNVFYILIPLMVFEQIYYGLHGNRTSMVYNEYESKEETIKEEKIWNIVGVFMGVLWLVYYIYMITILISLW